MNQGIFIFFYLWFFSEFLQREFTPENNIKYLGLKKSTKYKIEYIEKEIQNCELMVSNMKKQIPNTLYKIELLAEKLNELKDEKEKEKE